MNKIFLPTLLLLGALSVSAQTSSLVSIKNSKGHGSGICLDTPCQHVITARHLIQQFGKLKVEGVSATEKIATGNRDLMLLTLNRPLARFVGVKLSDESPKEGQEIISISDFLGVYHRYAGKITLADYTSMLFTISDGGPPIISRAGDYFMMDYLPVKGDSGGAIFKDGKLIGLLIAQTRDAPNGKVTGAVALSVKVIKQWLANGDVPASVVFTQRKTVRWYDILDMPPKLDSRDPVSMIQAVSVRAGKDAEGVQKVYATQITDFADLDGAKSRSIKYQIEGYGDTPVYRKIRPSGNLAKEKIGFPVPNDSVIPGAAWHFLLASVADQHPITYQGFSSLGGLSVRVFHKDADPCTFFIGGVNVNGFCDDDIITDLNSRVVAISRNISLPAGLEFSDIQVVFRYDEIAFDGLDKLCLPVFASMIGAGAAGIYRSETHWTNYKRYSGSVEVEK